MFAYNRDTKSYELVVPTEYDSIKSADGLLKNVVLWKNGRLKFLDDKFKNAFDDKDYFMNSYLVGDYDFSVVLKRENKNDIWYKQRTASRAEGIFLDSIFKIDKIKNDMQYAVLKRETQDIFYKIITLKKKILHLSKMRMTK